MADFVDVLPLDQLPEQGFRAVWIGEQSVLVGRTGGQVFACIDRCPHAAAPLRIGRLRGDQLQCAWHGWVFNAVTGESVPNNPAFRLTQLPVKIEDGRVWVAYGAS